MKMKNTKKMGILHFLIYKEPVSEEYTGVCLELGLLEVGKNPDYLKQSLIDAAKGFVHTIIKEDLPDDFLNVPPAKEYEKLYLNALQSLRIGTKSDKLVSKSDDVFVFTKPLIENSFITP